LLNRFRLFPTLSKDLLRVEDAAERPPIAADGDPAAPPARELAVFILLILLTKSRKVASEAAFSNTVPASCPDIISTLLLAIN
jgi:hypothetical protein